VCQAERGSILGFREGGEDLLLDPEIRMAVMGTFLRIGQPSDELSNLLRTDRHGLRVRQEYHGTVFRAIEVDPTSRERTGRELELVAETRQSAITELLEVVEARLEEVEVDPSRTVVKIGARLWTLVSTRPQAAGDAPALRRAGAKHKRVR
jgi:hypothetical protein